MGLLRHVPKANSLVDVRLPAEKNVFRNLRANSLIFQHVNACSVVRLFKAANDIVKVGKIQDGCRHRVSPLATCGTWGPSTRHGRGSFASLTHCLYQMAVLGARASLPASHTSVIGPSPN